MLSARIRHRLIMTLVVLVAVLVVLCMLWLDFVAPPPYFGQPLNLTIGVSPQTSFASD